MTVPSGSRQLSHASQYRFAGAGRTSVWSSCCVNCKQTFTREGPLGNFEAFGEAFEKAGWSYDEKGLVSCPRCRK
jgi:hypothetical protein